MWLILCAVIGAGIGTCRADCPDPNQFQNWKPVYMEQYGEKLGVTITNPDQTATIKAAILIVDQNGYILVFATFDGATIRRFVLNDKGFYEEDPLDEDAYAVILKHFKLFVKCEQI